MLMKAVVLHGNRDLRVETVPIPDLAADECRVAIRAAGICSSDVPRAFQGHAYHYPLTMGHELAGEVVAVGSDAIHRFSVGDRVAIFPLLPCGACPKCMEHSYAQCSSYSYYGSRRNGGFAEFLNVRAWNLLALPPEIDLDDAALIEPTAVAWHALSRAGLLDTEARQEVVVIGAGFLGLMAIELLRRRTSHSSVTIIDRNRYKLELAAEAGASTVFLQDNADWESFARLNSGRFPVVIEASGMPGLFRRSIDLARANGSVLWMGNISGNLTLPQSVVSSILRKELSILGTWNSSYNGTNPSDWVDVRDLLAEGLKPSAFVTTRIGLEEVPETIRRMNAHKERTEVHEFIKVVVRP